MPIVMQTNFSVEEIVGFLESGRPVPDYPRCLLINELGIRALASREAEEALRKMLPKEEGDCEKRAAYRFLSMIEDPELETREILRRFRENPKNKAAVSFAEEAKRNL
jgi:hypothetical protein